MKAVIHTFLFIALVCSASHAQTRSAYQRARSGVRSAATTSLDFQPAPPSPLRGTGSTVRNAGFDEDFRDSSQVRRTEFTSDDFTNEPAADNRGYVPPPVMGQTAREPVTTQRADGMRLTIGEDEFDSNDNFGPPPATSSDDEFSNRVYVPPTRDLGPTNQRPQTSTGGSTLSTQNLTAPPPAAVPRRTLPPSNNPNSTVRNQGTGSTNFENPNTNFDSRRRTTAGSNSTLGYVPPTQNASNYTAPQRGTTLRPQSPTVTTQQTARTPISTTPRTGQVPRTYNGSNIRQAQAGPITGSRDMIPPPTNQQLSNPIENAANTAANTMERGAIGVSNAIRNGAERISEEGQRRGNSYFLTLLALFASVGLNFYLGWIAWDTYNRYQDLVSDMRYTSPRRSKAMDTEPAYSDSPLVEAASY